MGYDVGRFQGDVDEELICTICGGVFQEPRQVSPCEHCFCDECIQEWVKHQQTCPVDRNPITSSSLGPAPRILRNLLARLKITCENEQFGCQAVVKLDGLESHLSQCEYNPKRPVLCEKGCGLEVPLDELPDHNCVQELHKVINTNEKRIQGLEERIQEQDTCIGHLREEVSILKELVRSFRTSANGVGTPDETERAIQTGRWLASLKPAKVKRWGGMISTPDGVLQNIIKRALADSGCPQHLLSELMANAHERKWPPGLSTLETRQLNRRRYEQYIAKRVPGRQAIIIMASDNEHMGESMIVEPGIVMVFAHGVE